MSKKKTEKSYNKKHARDSLQEKIISGQNINEFINEEWLETGQSINEFIKEEWLKTKNLIELITKGGR